jgi:hypothetical protein
MVPSAAPASPPTRSSPPPAAQSATSASAAHRSPLTSEATTQLAAPPTTNSAMLRARVRYAPPVSASDVSQPPSAAQIRICCPVTAEMTIGTTVAVAARSPAITATAGTSARARRGTVDRGTKLGRADTLPW